jgi:predicted ester cyclase
VASRWTQRATKGCEYLGVSPTGEQLVVAGITIFRIVNDKIEEIWFDCIGRTS